MVCSCPRCEKNRACVRTPVRAGRFYRKSDSQWVQRFRCRECGLFFSSATRDPCYQQKKRRKNYPLEKLLGHGFSMRECARFLNIHRKTVERKKRFLAIRSTVWSRKFWIGRKVSRLQFDDMETFEHSKLKPLSVTLAVDKETRLILGAIPSQMPAKGHLAKKSLKKYGFRKDLRKEGRRKLFEEIKANVLAQALIESDQNPHYEVDVREYFPEASYVQFKGRRGCVVGQGELKGGGFDPLFSLNHTCAMFRANVNRLFRRTWCTSKTVKGLQDHLAIYVKVHNQRIMESL